MENDKPEWQKAVEKIEAQRVDVESSLDRLAIQRLAEVNYERLMSVVRAKGDAQKVINEQRKELNEIASSHGSIAQQSFYRIYSDEYNRCLEKSISSAAKGEYALLRVTAVGGAILIAGLVLFSIFSTNNGSNNSSSGFRSSVAVKTYTPAELRNMVDSGRFPNQGSPSTQKQTMEFSLCVSKVDGVVGSVRPQYPAQIVVNTEAMYIAKIWTNDGAMILSCSAPDSAFVTTIAKYL